MNLEWSTPELTLTFDLDNGPVRVTAGSGREPSQPLVEVSALGYGRSPGTSRHVDTVLGQRLRYVTHEDSGSALRIANPAELSIFGFLFWAVATHTYPEAQVGVFSAVTSGARSSISLT